MANSYRETQALDLAAEREEAVLRGATIALAVIAAFSVADLLITGGEFVFVDAKHVAAAASLRIVLPGAVYALFTLGGMVSIHRAAGITRRSWVLLFVLAGSAIAACAASIELARMTVQRIPESQLLEWTKDLDIVIRANALFRPVSVAALLVYAGARWIRRGSRPTKLDCPSCGAPLDTR